VQGGSFPVFCAVNLVSEVNKSRRGVAIVPDDGQLKGGWGSCPHCVTVQKCHRMTYVRH